MELFSLLLGTTCVLAAVAVVGHGIWVAVAWVVGAGAKTRRSCPRCGVAIEGDRCGVCEWPVPPHVARRRPLAALGALEKQAEDFHQLGILDPAAFQSLTKLVHEERDRLIAAREARAAEAAAAAPAPPVEAAKPLAEHPLAADLVSPFAPRPAPPIAAPPKQKLPEHVPPAEYPLTAAAPVTDSVAERAAQFQAARAAASNVAASHVVEPTRPTPAHPPAAPRRPWFDLLAAFMEERNMRWGEMVGGLLIVCCSIALVISFWSAIAERPWLKFFLFNGVTAGLFGLGFHCEHRWRLRTTSQGLLIIASMLVPLNFLAIAAFTTSPAADSPLTLVGEAVSVGLFAWLVYGAGEILIEQGPLWLVAGLLIPSLAQLLVRRFVGPASSVSLMAALAALPLSCYLVVNGWLLRRAARVDVLSEREVNALFKFFGLTSFATLLPLALLLFKSEQPLETLRQLPFVVVVLGLAPLAVGLTLWQKLAGRGQAGLRTAGTTIGVLGALISLSGLVLGWPEPRAMLPSALVEFAVFTLVAWRFAIPMAHLVAAACVAIAWLLGANLWQGEIAWSGDSQLALARALVSGRSGTLLAPLVVLYAAAAFASLRGRGRSAVALVSAAGALAAVSVALVSWFGFGVEGDPIGAGWVYLVYAAAALALAARSHRLTIPWIGAALLLAGVVQEVVFHYGEILHLAQPEVTALLTAATLAVTIALVVQFSRAADGDSQLEAVLWTASFVASLAAAAWLTVTTPQQGAAFAAAHWFWLAWLWLAIGLAIEWPGVWTLFQVALGLATVFAVVARLEREPWFAESSRPWLDPWTLCAMGIALAGLNLAWAAARFAVGRAAAPGKRPPSAAIAHAAELLASPWLLVDRVTTGALVALLVAIATYAALPGVLQELSPRAPAPAAVAGAPTVPPPRVVPPIENFQWPGVPHDHAAGWGSWALAACVLVLVAVTALEQRSSAWVLCLLVVAAAGCPLLASRWESDVAVASALRWFSAGLLLVGSAPVWGRDWVARQAARVGWQSSAGAVRLDVSARSLVFFLGLLPPVAMALGIGLAALARAQHAQSLWTNSFPLVVLVFVAVLLAGALQTLPHRVLPRRAGAARPTWPSAAAALLLVLGTAPILSVLLYEVGIALKQSPILGPNSDSIFFRIGLAGSYAAPILMIALVLVGYAIRERSSGFALAGGLVLNAGATAAYLLAISKGGLRFDAPQWIRLAQLNAAVAACYALAWLALLVRARRRVHDEGPIATDFLLNTQFALAPALMTLALGWAWCDLVWDPQKLQAQLVMNPELADVWGWASFALACLSTWVALWAAGRRVSLLGTSAFLVAVAIFAAVIASGWDTGNWLAYNTLLVGHGVIGAVLLAVAWNEHRQVTPTPVEGEGAVPLGDDRGSAVWVVVQGMILFALSLRELVDNYWWPVGGLAFLGVLLAPATACVFQRRRYLYVAAAMINGAGLLLALARNWLNDVDDFVYLNVILLALPVVPWMVIELRAIRPRKFEHALVPPMHRVAARGSLVILAIVVAIGLYTDAMGRSWVTSTPALPWLALAATGLAAATCLWDAASRDAIAVLYVFGLIACAMLLDVFDLSPPQLLWLGAAVTAAYAVATSYLWSCRAGLLLIGERLKIPQGSKDELAGLKWLVPANLFLAALVVLLTAVLEWTERQMPLRLLASQATLSQVVSVALLARGDRRGVLQWIALVLGAVGAVMFAWSFLEVDTTLTVLNALVVLAAALAAVSALYGFGLGKLLADTSDWLAPARRLTPWLAGTCAAALVVILGVEILEFSERGEVAIAGLAIAAVAVTLLGLSIAALAAAVLPGRDPLGLSERGRTAYVYGAEIVLAILFVHIRLTIPWLFSGVLREYWPVIVMAIAFVGVGFAEFCRRRQQHVLAGPIENTGVLLPVLPVLGFWADETSVDYSLLLLLVGVLYAGLSITRRSFGFGVLAALAANGGLWFFLSRHNGLAFLAHPQIWLIPPALCVLGAAYLNRRQLSETQMTAIRYFTSMTIYLSSTGDIFMNGVAQAPYLPLVLAVLSIAGILGGMLLRVRAFLFLGTGFLVLSLFTIIWHAAVDLEQTWILWVSGIVLGLLIVALFALFEKKRQEVLEMMEKIKQWDG